MQYHFTSFFSGEKFIFIVTMSENRQQIVKRAERIIQSLKKTYPDAKCSLNYSSPHELLVATILSAQSYDAAKMFIQAIRSGANNRLQIKDKLNKIRGFKGVSGSTTILPSGEADKKLFTVKINKRKVTEVN